MAGVLLIFLVIGGVVALLGQGLEQLKKSEWTGEAVVGVILGLLIVLFEWLASWPGYVWLILIGAFIAFRITSQLDYLARRIRRLERRVVALTKALKKEHGGGNDFEDEDEW
jgi:hypothetical protein